MPNLPNPADVEFDDDVQEPKQDSQVPDHSAEIAGLKDQNASLANELTELKSRTAIINRLQEALGVKTEDPKDTYIRKEIKRLVPEIDDLDKIKVLLPEILVTLQAAAE